MSAAPELRVGVIGYGVMGKAHCYAHRVAPMLRRLPVTPVVSVISGRDEPAVAGRPSPTWAVTAAQAVCAAIETSAEQDRWVPVAEVTGLPADEGLADT